MGYDYIENVEKKMDLSEELRMYSTVNNSRPTPQPANAMKNFSGSGQFEDSSVSRRDHQGSRSLIHSYPAVLYCPFLWYSPTEGGVRKGLCKASLTSRHNFDPLYDYKGFYH